MLMLSSRPSIGGTALRVYSTLSASGASTSSVAFLRLTLAVCLLAALAPARDSAKGLYKKARKAEKAGNLAQAYVWYAQAAALDPGGDTDAWGRSLALRTQALTEMDTKPAGLDDASPGPYPGPDRRSLLGIISLEELKEARQPLPPIELQASGDVKDFDLRADPRQLYEQVARAYGLDVIFDSDYQPSNTIRFRISEVDYRQALRTMQAATNTFIVPVSERLFLAAQDTQQKRQELEQNMAVVVPIPETVSVQETQELARAVQQLMEIQKLTVDSQRGLVLIRDRVSKVRPAQAVFEQLLYSRPEVVVEVEFLEVVEGSNLSYGLRLPTSIGIDFLGLPGTSGLIPLGLPGLSLNLFGLGIADAEILASMSRTSTRTLLRSQVRAVSGQEATLHVGDKYPILTQGYFGPVEGPGQVYTPPPTINFEDLGVVVKVTPYVHGDGEVTLEVDTEFKVLAGESLNGIPIIANRSFQGVARLKENEWAVMAGLFKKSEVRAITGLAGLSQIPYLGALFRQTTTERQSSDALLVLKPSIVRLPPDGSLARQIWTGTETKPVSPL